MRALYYSRSCCSPTAILGGTLTIRSFWDLNQNVYGIRRHVFSLLCIILEKESEAHKQMSLNKHRPVISRPSPCPF